MFIRWVISFLLFISLSTEAKPLLCSLVLKGSSLSATEKINLLNEKYDHFFFEGDNVLELYKDRPALTRWYKTRQLKKRIDKIDQLKGSSSFELKAAVYALNRLAFMAASEHMPLTYLEKATIADAKKVLLNEGLESFLQSHSQQTLSKTFLSRVWRGVKISFHFMFHPIAWRWTLAVLKMPHLVNQQMPLELAEKIAWEGLTKHKKEAQKYLPILASTKGFNQFASFYNHALVVALFTVGPYVAQEQYQIYKEKGEHAAAEQILPTVESTKQMSEYYKNFEIQDKIYQRTIVGMEQLKGAPLTDAEKQLAHDLVAAEMKSNAVKN